MSISPGSGFDIPGGLMTAAVSMEIDDRRFRAAFARYMAHSKRAPQVVLEQRAKIFVRDAIKVTPPNKGGAGGRSAGSRAIRGDIYKIMRSSTRGTSNPAALHARFRRRDGRVKTNLRSSSKDKRIRVRNLAAYVKSVQERVGLLASGWNAAAMRFGVNPPSWIMRHGRARGSVMVLVKAEEMEIKIVNRARHAGSAKGFGRRIQWVLNRQARQLHRQMDDFAVKRAARQAGWKMG